MTRLAHPASALLTALALQALALPASAAPAALPVALVLQDGVALHAAARESSPNQAQMLRGEAVEIRGERLDWYQVWDYGRERGGYLRRSQLLPVAGDTAQLLAQLRVAMPQEGAEGLALGLAAAYVQAASAQQLSAAEGAEVLDDLGQLGQRIAANGVGKRASQLDVAARYGLVFRNYEQADGSIRICYDGDAFRRVLALQAAPPAAKARAALALTRTDCRSTSLSAQQRIAADDEAAEVLARAPLDGLAAFERNRLLLRRIGVTASRAFEHRDPALASAALADFARLQPAELAEEDLPDYNDAAMRANAARWLTAAPSAERSFALGLRLVLKDGAGAGERCLALRSPKGDTLVERCTFAQVSLASAQMNREGTALAIAAQPLDGWRELWVLRASKDGWSLDVLPPAAATPGIGYAEFAGWVPGGQQLLVVTESRAEGRYGSRRFVQLDLATLAPQRQAFEANQLGSFQRWADPAWRGASLALR